MAEGGLTVHIIRFKFKSKEIRLAELGMAPADFIM